MTIQQQKRTTFGAAFTVYEQFQQVVCCCVSRCIQAFDMIVLFHLSATRQTRLLASSSFFAVAVAAVCRA